MNKRLLAVLLVIFVFFTEGIKVSAASYHEGEVEEYVLHQLASANIPGMSMSIVTSQKEVYSAAFGDVSDTTSDMQIGVLTRTFTSLAVMQLVQSKKLSLDDKLSKYVKDENTDLNMSVEDCLNYIDDNDEDSIIGGFNQYRTDEPEILSVNHMYNLLGQVIEKASGSDYNTYIEKNILKPLDMKSTYTLDNSVFPEDIAYGHRNYFGLPVKDKSSFEQEEYRYGIPSGGIVSDIKDMGKYAQMYLQAGGNIVSYDSIQSIMNNGSYSGISVFNTRADYSMGWTATEVYDQTVYYVCGVFDNCSSAMFILPESDIGVVMLFNAADVLTARDFINEIAAGIVSIVLGETGVGIDANSYFMTHIVVDVIYFIALIFALLPILMIEVWIRISEEKLRILMFILDVLIHIVAPTVLIFLMRYYLAPWNVVMRIVPDLFWVALVVICLLYLGAVVKCIIGLLNIKNKVPDIQQAEENAEYEQEIVADNKIKEYKISEKNRKQNRKRSKAKKSSEDANNRRIALINLDVDVSKSKKVSDDIVMSEANTSTIKEGIEDDTVATKEKIEANTEGNVSVNADIDVKEKGKRAAVDTGMIVKPERSKSAVNTGTVVKERGKKVPAYKTANVGSKKNNVYKFKNTNKKENSTSHNNKTLKEIIAGKEKLKGTDKGGNDKNSKPIKIKVENKPLDYKNGNEAENNKIKSVSSKDN